MGVIAQPFQGLRQTGSSGIPIESPRMVILFNEFMRRYNELKEVRRKETWWLSIVLISGGVALFYLLYSQLPNILIAILLLTVFFVSLRRYLSMKALANHVYVNVHILHHHLMGKLEVGFCNHSIPCSCAEDFRRFVWEKYKISFYGDKQV